MMNEILYSVIACLVIGIFFVLGAISNMWYLTAFKKKIGNVTFYLYLLIALIIFAAIIYITELDYSWTIKLIIVLGTIIANLLITAYLYKRNKL